MGWFKRKNNNVEEEERRRRRLNDMATSDPLHASLERPFSYQDQQPEQDDGVVLGEKHTTYLGRLSKHLQPTWDKVRNTTILASFLGAIGAGFFEFEHRNTLRNTPSERCSVNFDLPNPISQSEDDRCLQILGLNSFENYKGSLYVEGSYPHSRLGISSYFSIYTGDDKGRLTGYKMSNGTLVLFRSDKPFKTSESFSTISFTDKKGNTGFIEKYSSGERREGVVDNSFGSIKDTYLSAFNFIEALHKSPITRRSNTN